MEIRLGESIRSLRRGAALTQEQLAEALGVTTGAVHKWESGKATPELPMLVDIAEFFETSVDALLNYGWEKLSMGQAVEKLSRYAADKQLEEGMRYAEKVLQKYPNSFDVVYKSAQLYFLAMDGKHAPRAIELYRKALSLLAQDAQSQSRAMAIRNRIAMCYCYMGNDEKAVELLKENNVDGLNDYQIGLLLSKEETRAREALKYLSDALVSCYSELYNLGIGYANAYQALGMVEEAADFILWLYELGKGLRDPAVVNWMDRGDVVLLLILAEMDVLRGREQDAREWLKKARDSAGKFDASPEYRNSVGMKFYHGSERSTSYDDMGDSAMSVIENHLADETVGKCLSPLWDAIRAEE